MNDAAIQALLDRQAIEELIHRYARAVDRLDEALGHSIFHADATADYGDYYRGSGHGAIDLICASHRHCLAYSHNITTTTIAIDGDHAGSEAYHFATLRVKADGRVMQVSIWGRYLDRWSRRDGVWGIDHRRVVRDMDETREVTPASKEQDGRHDRDDPSYAVLELTRVSA